LLLATALAGLAASATGQTSLPVINIHPLDAEGAESPSDRPNTAAFRVTHNLSPAAEVSFLFTLGGTAAEGVDYAISSESAILRGPWGSWFTFPPGRSEAELVITPLDDILIEEPETVVLSLHTPPLIGAQPGTGGVTLEEWRNSFGFAYGANSSATVAILSDDVATPPIPVITVAAADATASETPPGSEAADRAVFSLTRSGPNLQRLTVGYALMSLASASPPLPAARSGIDFEALSGSATFAEGSVTADIMLNPHFDVEAEGSEFVGISLLPSLLPASEPGAYLLDQNTSATVEILDYAPAGTPLVAIEASDPQAVEEDVPRRTGGVTVRRQGPVDQALTVYYRIGGSAENGVDYLPLPGVVTLAAGSGSALIPIEPINDNVPEEEESVALQLAPPPVDIVPPPYLLREPVSASVTIRDRLRSSPESPPTDPPPTDPPPTDPPPTDPPPTDPPPTDPPPTDPPPTDPPPTDPPPTDPPPTDPPPTDPPPTDPPPTDPPPQSEPLLPEINIFPLDPEGAEAPSAEPNAASFRVTHNFAPTAVVRFLFSLGGTAVEGEDYRLVPDFQTSLSPVGRWFTFPAGQTEAEITIAPVDDQLVEEDKTVTLSLHTPPMNGSNPDTSGATLKEWRDSFGFAYGATFSAMITILDDDIVPPPFAVVSMTATDATASEPRPGSSFEDPAILTLTRSGSNLGSITVQYALESLEGASPPLPRAMNGEDFETLTGSIEFPEGTTTALIVVKPLFDLLSEESEYIKFTLLPSPLPATGPGGYLLGEETTALVKILDHTPANVPVVTIVANDPGAIEEDAPRRTASLTVSRQGDTTAALDVRYELGGSALNGVDFAELSGVVTIPANRDAATITIDPLNDTLPEPVESVGVTLLPPAPGGYPPPYALGRAITAGVTIRDRLRSSPEPEPETPAPTRPSLERLPEGTVILRAPSPEVLDGVVSIEVSSDLANWEVVGAARAVNGVAEFTHVGGGTRVARFYRARPASP
jgi:hypothetical protein